jgi:predicted pyridoxine 5'-phosphate oxidase superfamily flavin-nucleotide-binding protein
MSRLYGEQHRALQDAFGTRNMADRIEQLACRTEFDEESKGFIEAMDMFFLATVDHQGRPTVSSKGGDPGFVKVVNRTTLVFPSYDGNGMFLSMGNVARHSQVGMLFISFERPHRLRLQGTASISRDDPMMSHYKEADCIVRVQLSELMLMALPRRGTEHENMADPTGMQHIHGYCGLCIARTCHARAA